jgi:dynein heavy chain
VGDTEKLLTRIDLEKTSIVEPKKVIVDEEVKQADVKAQAAKAIKQECESILEEAIPALNAAISALDTIKAADIRLVQVSFVVSSSSISMSCCFTFIQAILI